MRRKLQVWAVLALAVALGGCSLVQPAGEAENIILIDPPPISRKPEYTAVVSTIEQTVTGSGKVMSMREEELYFTADQKRVTEVYVNAGDRVTAGQLIAELEIGDLEHQIALKEIQLQRDELQLREKLRSGDPESLDLELAQLEHRMKRAELERMRETLQSSRLVAPFTGVVVSVSKKPGDYVRAYESVAVMIDPDRLVAAAKLSSADLNAIAVGMEAVVEVNLAGRHRGRVIRLPGSQPGSGSDSIEHYVLVELERWPEQIQAGTPLSMAVVTDRREEAVLVPPSAVRTHAGRTYVQVMEEDGSRREVDVEIGIVTATEVEIRRGLNAGQKVVGN